MAQHMTPLGAVGRGLAAAAAGTVAITVSQVLEGKVRGHEPPTGAGVAAQRILSGVFQRDVPAERAAALNTPTHFAYGTAWGTLYALGQESRQLPPLVPAWRSAARSGRSAPPRWWRCD